MNTKNIIKTGLLGLIASFAFASPVFADHHETKMGGKSCDCDVKGKMGKWKGQHATHGNFFLKFKEDLKLDEKQVASLEAISTSFKAQQEKTHETVSSKQAELNKVAMGESYDAKAVSKLSSEIGELHGKMLENRYSKLHEASAVLTPEQKTQAWAQMEEKHMEKMEKHKAMKKNWKKKANKKMKNK